MIISDEVSVFYTYNNNSIGFISRQNSAWNTELMISNGIFILSLSFYIYSSLYLISFIDGPVFYPKVDYTSKDGNVTYHLIVLTNSYV